MQLFRSPLFQEAPRPRAGLYRDRVGGRRYGCRSVPARQPASVTQEARIVAARELTLATAVELAAQAAAAPAFRQYDRAA